MADGTYAAVEFKQFDSTDPVSGLYVATFNYKYPLPAETPPPTPIVSGIQLTSTGWGNGDEFQGFKFDADPAAAAVVPYNQANDFYVEVNTIWLSEGVTILPLGNQIILAEVDSVPGFGYFGGADFIPPFSNTDPPYDATGYVYALRLADGTYAAIRFTEFGHDVNGDENYPYRTTLEYKYPLPADSATYSPSKWPTAPMGRWCSKSSMPTSRLPATTPTVRPSTTGTPCRPSRLAIRFFFVPPVSMAW